MKLYEISSEYRDVMRAVDDADGELDDALERRLDAVQEDLATKVESCAVLARELKAEAAAIRDEEKRLAERRRTVEARRERLLEYVRCEMERADVPAIRGRVLSVRRQLGPAKVVVDAEHMDAALAGWGVSQDPKLDRRALKAAVEAGDEVATMIATLERTERVVVR